MKVTRKNNSMAGGGPVPPLITKSPTKNGANHHITNKKWLKSPSPNVPSDHLSPSKKLQITTHFLAPKWKFLLKNGNFQHLFCSYFRSGIITKSPTKIAQSPSPQLLKITKSPLFSATNHQITKQKVGKSPSPQLLKITKSPIFSGTNHQITNKKTARSPITKNTRPPPLQMGGRQKFI